MKQFILHIALPLYILLGSVYAFADIPDTDTSIYSGTPLEDAPLVIDPPKGYIFFNGEKTRNILTEYFDNDPSDLTDIVGMLIPDTLSSMQYLGRSAWMFTYDKSGHVNDSHADNMGFSWLIEAYSANSTPGEKFSWAWKPEYNQDSHLLILPYLHTKNNTTELVLQMKMFGNDGVLEIERFASPSISDKIKKEATEIADGISYTRGNRYIDFGLDQSGSSFNSVSSYLKGIPVNKDAGIESQEEEKDSTHCSSLHSS